MMRGRLRAGAVAGAILPIRIWRYVLGAAFGPACRFEPSCGEYAELAVRRFGVVRGLMMAGRRVLRCNPWHAGGFDPVAERDAPSEYTDGRTRGHADGHARGHGEAGQ